MSGRRCDVSSIGQRSKRILRGKTGNVISRLDGLLDRRSREVRGVGIASALADIDRDAQRFVAVSLYVFELAFAYRDTQATALGGFSGGVAGADFFGMRKGAVNQIFKERTAVAKATASAEHSLGWDGLLHIGGYDTWLCPAN